MFTWICPKCGTEVPPSYNDCPNCAARDKAAAAPPAPVAQAPLPVYAPPPQAPQYAPPQYVPPQPYAPQPQQYAPQPQYAPAPPQYAPVPPQYAPPPAAPVQAQPPLMGTAPTEPAPPPSFSYGGAPSTYDAAPPPAVKGGLPSWLIAVLSIVGVAGLGYGVLHFMRDKGSVAAESATMETAKPSGEASPLAKYVEVVGFRIIEDKQKVQLKFILVNHSSGEIAPFDLELQVRTKNQKPDDAPLFTVKTPVSGVLPFEAKDMTIPVKTSLRAYEIPDWQFLTGTFQILQP
ncbi:MAG: zinc ribbon domain-containing protein [Bryobacteraceae bacterium]|nr:zinc ribbon domain-containing protein [Bryobacteraceae bacterium]